MLTSPVLETEKRIRHGFFTREGGVSGGIYASLNCGMGSDDDAANVVENKRRAAARLGLDETALVTLYQVHSARVVRIENAAETMRARPEADAMVTDRPGVMLGILTADCAPVLFADPANRIVGAAHAGWRGAVSGIVEETVTAMEALGAERRTIRASVGPCIARVSYQVGPEFPAPFLAESEDNAAFFTPEAEGGHFRFDLLGYVLSRLRQAGLGAVDAVTRDTYAEEELFFSYRRTCHRGEGDYGRGLSAIAIGE